MSMRWQARGLVGLAGFGGIGWMGAVWRSELGQPWAALGSMEPWHEDSSAVGPGLPGKGQGIEGGPPHSFCFCPVCPGKSLVTLPLQYVVT